MYIQTTPEINKKAIVAKINIWKIPASYVPAVGSNILKK